MTSEGRQNEYWMPEPIFRGETVFCLASGPSLTREVAEKVRGRPTIVVNSSYALAPWADVLYFTDSSWYEQRREIVANWPGMVISMSPTAKRELPDKVKRVQGRLMGEFPPGRCEVIRQGRSSGHTIVSLAIGMAAKRVALVGYDMRLVDGKEHHHSEYSGARDLDQYAREFVPAFRGWNQDALDVGVEVLNCTPGSAIDEFPFSDLDDVLAEK